MNRRRLLYNYSIITWDHVYTFTNNTGGELLNVTAGQKLLIEWDCPNGNLNGWIMNGNGNTSKDLAQIRTIGLSGTDSINVTGTGQVRIGAYSTSGTFSVKDGIIKVKLI